MEIIVKQRELKVKTKFVKNIINKFNKNYLYKLYFQLDKELDCKKSCKQFYKKYFDLTVEAKKKQVKYYEESKQKKLKKDVEFEIK